MAKKLSLGPEDSSTPTRKVGSEESPVLSPISHGNKATATRKSKPYTSVGVKDHNVFRLPERNWRLIGLLTIVASVVRLFRIYQPSSVVFDEVHFGGFASKYIKGAFFMDVHPPLGKLLITLAGWLAGLDGSFDFKDIGKDYVEPKVPYVSMRLLSAFFGILTVPTIFLTLKASGCRTITAFLGSGLVILENGLLTQSRLILLDSPLVIFTAMSVLSWTSFTNQHELGPKYAFKGTWWFWLVSSGVCLGATVSVKWVGLFTIAWVGSLTVIQLWNLLGDYHNVTPRIWFKHFFARAFCLIVLPLTFYLVMFGIHFICLVNPGDGDGFMSTEFQATLNSKSMQDVPADVIFGSRVSIRHYNTHGGYLHSHDHSYPSGSGQQQITLYPHKDQNNNWILENQTQPEGLDGPILGPSAWDNIDPSLVEDGSIIRLHHSSTNRRLHSHDVRAPVTDADWQNEVTAYGYEGFEGDANDFFRLEIVKSMSKGTKAKTHLRTIETKFRLIHVLTDCALFSHIVKLPDWGYGQQEVTCARGGTLPNSIWYVESNMHPSIMNKDVEKVNYQKPRFFSKFWELQKVMWRTNAGLVDSHNWESRPYSWPILRRGINFWSKDHRQIYLIGNPVIWWSSTAAIVIYLLAKYVLLIANHVRNRGHNTITMKRFDYEIGTTVLGWALHYFPFFLMRRQLFLHHYFPALYFSILTLCQMFDFIFVRFRGLGLSVKPVIGKSVVGLFLVVSAIVFSIYAPLAYGNAWTRSTCRSVKLFNAWDWDCNTFHSSYDKYKSSSPLVNIPSSDSPSESQVKRNRNKSKKDPEDAQPNEDHLGVEYVVEYHDDQGNILNDEQVAELQGKVSFMTRYETRRRMVDSLGHELENAPLVVEQEAE